MIQATKGTFILKLHNYPASITFWLQLLTCIPKNLQLLKLLHTLYLD